MVQRLKCPKCATLVTVQPGEAPVCPNCGFRGPVSAPLAPPRPVSAPPSAQAPTASPPPAPQMAPAEPYLPSPGATIPGYRPPVTQGVAIAALLVNLLIPGVGSLIGGRKTEGIWQLVMVVAGILLLIVIVGAVILLAAWIWGIVTGVQLLQHANKAPRST